MKLLLYIHVFAEVAIGLETVSFTVTEDVGTVEVCVNLNCPTSNPNCAVAFIFGVNFATIDDTAGKRIINCANILCVALRPVRQLATLVYSLC